MRHIDTGKREECRADVLKYLTKIKRPTTIGEINSKIGYNRYMIDIALSSLKDQVMVQERYITLKSR